MNKYALLLYNWSDGEVKHLGRDNPMVYSVSNEHPTEEQIDKALETFDADYAVVEEQRYRQR